MLSKWDVTKWKWFHIGSRYVLRYGDETIMEREDKKNLYYGLIPVKNIPGVTVVGLDGTVLFYAPGRDVESFRAVEEFCGHNDYQIIRKFWLPYTYFIVEKED